VTLSRGKRVALRTVAVALAAAGAVAIMPAGAAQANVYNGGFFNLCANGNYTSWVSFPYRNITTVPVSPGSCISFWYGGANQWQQADVYGIDGATGDSIYLGTDNFVANEGDFIATHGTINGDAWWDNDASY
jgi:hypothetical protein